MVEAAACGAAVGPGDGEELAGIFERSYSMEAACAAWEWLFQGLMRRDR